MQSERQFRKSNKRQHLALALLARGSGGTTVQQQITNVTNVTNMIDVEQSPFQQEARVIYVDVREGSDEPPEGEELLHGAYNHPFRNLSAALDHLGEPVSQGQFEQNWTIRVRGDGEVRDVGQAHDGVIHLPNRRLRIELQAGLWLENKFQWDLNNAFRFGSTRFWHLEFACPGGRAVFGEPGGNLNALSARVGDGTDLLNLTADAAASRPVILCFNGVGTMGTILHDNNFVAGDIGLSGFDTWFTAGRIGPAVVGNPHKLDVNQVVNCVFNATVAVKARLVAFGSQCVIANDWDVSVTPVGNAGSLVAPSGLNDCFIDATASWVGNGTLLLDTKTNYWAKTNAPGGFLAAVKVITSDAVA